MKNQPKEVDEFAETEVLDSSRLEALGTGGHDAEAAALYEEYSQLAGGEASSQKTGKKRRR